MVDDIKNIDSPQNPLFRIRAVKKVREVSKRPEEEREGRDTYSESDELLLSREAELLKRDRSARDKLKAARAKEAKVVEKVETPEEEPQEGTDTKKKHVNVIV